MSVNTDQIWKRHVDQLKDIAEKPYPSSVEVRTSSSHSDVDIPEQESPEH